MNTITKTYCSLPSWRWSKPIVIALLVLSCHGKQKVRYPYQESLIEYVAKYHGLNLTGCSAILLAVPLNSCSPCVEQVLHKVTTMDNPHVWAIVWADSKKDLLPYNLRPKGRSHVSVDTKGNYKGYDLGIFVPAVLKYEKGTLVYMKSLSTGNIEEAFKQLGL